MAGTQVSTYVFLDLESTGLGGIGERPRITELSLVAVHKFSLMDPVSPCMSTHPDPAALCARLTPRVLNKLTVCVYPMKGISSQAASITGLSKLY